MTDKYAFARARAPDSNGRCRRGGIEPATCMSSADLIAAYPLPNPPSVGEGASTLTSALVRREGEKMPHW